MGHHHSSGPVPWSRSPRRLCFWLHLGRGDDFLRLQVSLVVFECTVYHVNILYRCTYYWMDLYKWHKMHKLCKKAKKVAPAIFRQHPYILNIMHPPMSRLCGSAPVSTPWEMLCCRCPHQRSVLDFAADHRPAAKLKDCHGHWWSHASRPFHLSRSLDHSWPGWSKACVHHKRLDFFHRCYQVVKFRGEHVWAKPTCFTKSVASARLSTRL